MAALNDAGTVKRDLAVLATAVVGWLAASHGDRVATVHGDTRAQHVSAGRPSEIHLERCLQMIHAATRTDAPHSDLNALLHNAIRTIRRRSILVVVHDEPELGREVVTSLRRLAAQHEVLVVMIGDLDPTSAALAARDVVGVDVDTGVRLAPGPRSDPEVRAEYAAIVRATRDRTAEILDRLGIVHERFTTTTRRSPRGVPPLERHRHVRRR